ncbi:MAG: hypothetical protein ACI9DH_000548 [Halioglobus sp.]|jgi:hypothetical protein
MKKYFITVGDALSQLLNVVVFFGGNANESLSGRCWRQREHWLYGMLRYPINAVASLFGETSHCKQSYLNDIERAQAMISSIHTPEAK